MTRSEASHRNLDEFIEAGSAIVGGASGATLAALIGGLEGGVIGAAVGTAFASGVKTVATEIKERFLGPREVARIGAAMVCAANHIEARLNEGAKVREDNFFGDSGNEQGPDRPAAEEIIEGVLLAAQRDPQERKLRFYGALLANIALDASVDRAQANLLIRLAEELSYRQLCLLTLFAGEWREQTRDTDYRKETTFSTSRLALLGEIFELYSKGLLNCSGTALLSIPHIVPRRMQTQAIGAVLVRLMGLSKIPRNDTLELLMELL